MTQSHPDRPTLTVEGGDRGETTVALSPGETIIVGSAPSAGLRIDHPHVAPIHARVGWDALGVSVVDARSGRGTWLNGERVEASPLSRGDVLCFADPRVGQAGPAIRVYVPTALAEPSDVAPVAPLPPKPRTAPPARIPGLAERIAAAQAGPRRKNTARLAALAAVVLVLAGGALLAKRLLWSGPSVRSVQPLAAEAGQRISIEGARFAPVAEQNRVWFGEVPADADSSSGDSLHLRVPAAVPPGDVWLAVETAKGRSGRVRFRVLPLLQARALEPEGGEPGDEVVLQGLGFGRGTLVSVASASAEVVSAEPRAVRFRVPALPAPAGARLPLVAIVDGRSTTPIPFVFGRLPRVESVEPAQAAAGEIVRLRGVGFAPEPDANAVTFDGTGAVVVAASRTELAVVVPLTTQPEAEVASTLLVQSRGRSSEPRSFPVLRLVEGVFVPRCVVQAAADGAAGGPVLVGTQLGPLMMLASRDEAESVARRALVACARLVTALDLARAGDPVAFEARDHPSGGVGVGIVGRADMIERVTAEDAAAYQRPPGVAARREAPAPAAVARLWAALLNDLFSVAVTGDAPTAATAVSPSAGRAFAELRRALPWQTGEGVSSAAAVALPAQTRRRLRDAALQVP